LPSDFIFNKSLLKISDLFENLIYLLILGQFNRQWAPF